MCRNLFELTPVHACTIYMGRKLTSVNSKITDVFEHGLGLAHSTDPGDLMFPEIATSYPYISECVINALVFLYDGATN